jgi:monoamine oxidase
VVIGAGIAGLGAAHALAERNYPVVVLEARNRIGGRIYTVDGIDYGAHWVHGTEGNPINTLARRLNAQTLFVGGDSTYTGGWDRLILRGRNGHQFGPDEKLLSILVADEIRDRLDTLRRKRVSERAGDLPVREALQLITKGMDLTDEARAAVEWHVALSVRDDCAADNEALSLMWWDDGYEVYGYGDSVLVDGFDRLTNGLANGLDIRLDHVVHTIEYNRASGSPVRIRTSRGDFEADAAIVTLPLGVLKAGAVAFEPPLRDAKQTAIHRVGMGNLTKIVAWFDEPFWDRDQYAFGYYRDGMTAGYPTTVVNLWATHRKPVLVTVIGGTKGREIEQWDDAAATAWLSVVLCDLFGAAAMPPRRVAVTTWNIDPFSRGAYSFMALGASPADIEALGEPIDDTLFFAGEHTSREHWGCAHGAYASGLREAARIVGDPAIAPPRHFTENRRWRDMMLRATRFFNLVSRSLAPDEMRRRIDVLSASEVFSVVPEGDMRILASMFDVVAVADGHLICREGDPATQAYVVAEGTVDVLVGADRRVVASMVRGGVFGEYGMFDEGVRTATVVARGATTLLVLDYPRFRNFLLAFPESTLALMKVTVERMRKANRTGSAPHASE